MLWKQPCGSNSLNLVSDILKWNLNWSLNQTTKPPNFSFHSTVQNCTVSARWEHSFSCIRSLCLQYCLGTHVVAYTFVSIIPFVLYSSVGVSECVRWLLKCFKIKQKTPTKQNIIPQKNHNRCENFIWRILYSIYNVSIKHLKHEHSLQTDAVQAVLYIRYRNSSRFKMHNTYKNTPRSTDKCWWLLLFFLETW